MDAAWTETGEEEARGGGLCARTGEPRVAVIVVMLTAMELWVEDLRVWLKVEEGEGFRPAG